MFDGDSQTAGTYGGGTTYVAKVLAALTETTGSNAGIGAQTLVDMQSNATDVDNLFPDHRFQNAVVVAWGGSNDLFFGADAATTVTRLEAYCTARRAVGWTVAVLTILPRDEVGTPGAYEASRQTVNASIRANWEAYADFFVDVADDPRLQNASDPTYFHSDLVHLNNTGRQVVADLVLAADFAA